MRWLRDDREREGRRVLITDVFHSFFLHLLNIRYVVATDLGSEDVSLNKTDKYPCPLELTF